MTTALDTVYTISVWYDGAREGVTSFAGQPHYYVCQLDYDIDGQPTPYLLTPIDEETFQLEMEHSAIYERYALALKEERTTENIYLSLPEDRARQEEINQLLEFTITTLPKSNLTATGKFHYGPTTTVIWTILAADHQ
ncbi:hypothetical protein [Hymenobacter norwichensis]|uniref:hypothetical protein n=1 Tax=Hymenobacter norwichensis TaxID=223903 RepID=UPI0012F73974|nr:hypothetical protein [Hymenobacter norwichensis]